MAGECIVIELSKLSTISYNNVKVNCKRWIWKSEYRPKNLQTQGFGTDLGARDPHNRDVTTQSLCYVAMLYNSCCGRNAAN